jgi:hypothetical protein
MDSSHHSVDGLAAADPLLRFYLGLDPDDRGRMFDEILAWDQDRLEYTHDYIQWLFPSARRGVNPSAPLLDEARIAAFRSDPRLQHQLVRSFERMLEFYGFKLDTSGTWPRVLKGDTWEQRRRVWLTPGNHNFLRITRILTALRTLGLPDLAHAYFAALDELVHSDAGPIIADSYRFWKSAVGEP